MTTFAAPLRVKRGLNDSTIVWQVEASGTASFGQQGNFVIEASGTTKFNGPGGLVAGSAGVPNIQWGNGRTVLTQEVTVLAINSAANPAQITLPSGAILLNAYVDVEAPFAAGALVTAFVVNLFLGASDTASAANTIAEISVSASNRYNLITGDEIGANLSLLRNITGTVKSFVSGKALATAATAGQAMLRLLYVY